MFEEKYSKHIWITRWVGKNTDLYHKHQVNMGPKNIGEQNRWVNPRRLRQCGLSMVSVRMQYFLFSIMKLIRVRRHGSSVWILTKNNSFFEDAGCLRTSYLQVLPCCQSLWVDEKSTTSVRKRKATSEFFWGGVIWVELVMSNNFNKNHEWGWCFFFFFRC